MAKLRLGWFLFGILAASAVHADALVELPRIGNWTLEDNAESCRLIGTFGEGKERIVARFTRYAPSDWFELKLYGQPLRASGPYSYLSIDFGPFEDPHPEWVTNGTADGIPFSNVGAQKLDDQRSLSSTLPLPPLDPEFEASVTTLTLRPSDERSYRLQLGPMHVNMAAMRRCTDDLVRGWGLDPAEQMALSRRVAPLTNPGSWIQSYDYPGKLLDGGHNAIIRFRLAVDEQGKVTGCHIQSGTSPEDFAITTCKLIIQRARFSPALDRRGEAVRSYFVNSVRWVAGE